MKKLKHTVPWTFCDQKLDRTIPWTYVICGFNGEEFVVTFYEKESQKTGQKEFRIEKVIKRKYVKAMINHSMAGLL